VHELIGGVMLDLVHEFDYIRWLVGKPEKIACIFKTILLSNRNGRRGRCVDPL
jgi:predicted dehydrogenase